MIKTGDKVQAVDFSEMLAICGTYHSKVSHGEVVGIDTDYADSVLVVWVNNDGEQQSVAYALDPAHLVAV